ncbi:MAG TPA: phage holin family protein [Terracidiphilus sp.]|nr:phage holin family protein [Terracidiphilus sp.]
MFQFVLQWLLSTITFMIVANALPGYSLDNGPWEAMLAGVVIGFFNALLGAVCRVITAPVVLILLAIFMFFVNTVLILVASHYLDGLNVSGTETAAWGALILTGLDAAFRILQRPN